MSVAIHRESEIGCEIQNAACAQSGTMLNLKVVTTAEHRREADATYNTGEDVAHPHGMVVAKQLVANCVGTQRIICADSFFASVATAMVLLAAGLRFIGVVKTATSGYPMASLSVIPLWARGQHASYIHVNAAGLKDTMAVLWVDRERRYLIATASTTVPGAVLERSRWLLVGSRAKRVAFTVEQPAVAEVYYSGCASIDRHNRCHQDDLKLERMHVTQDWAMRVNLSLLGICEVDAWLLYLGAKGAAAILTQAQFYEDLAEALIDNTYDSLGIGCRGMSGARGAADEPASVRCGVELHLTPPLKRLHKVLAGDAD